MSKCNLEVTGMVARTLLNRPVRRRISGLPHGGLQPYFVTAPVYVSTQCAHVVYESRRRDATGDIQVQGS